MSSLLPDPNASLLDRIKTSMVGLKMTAMAAAHIEPIAAFPCPSQPPLLKCCNDRLSPPWLP